MATPIRNKGRLWVSRNRGIKSRIFGGAKPSALNRDDIPDVQVTSKIKRGDLLQELRLKYYPSIDVDLRNLYAGEMPGASLSDAENRLVDLGYRNNPTAYVEVTDEHGPDDGSYSRQKITEDGGRLDIPQVTNQPAYWKRLKLQNHITLYELSGGVIFLAHEEVSAWLQPARHVVDNEASARIGVREFRQAWFDEFNEELRGKKNVKWEVLR
jgi:hypothetical protein